MNQTEVKKVAYLARLSVLDTEVDKYAKNLTDILELAAQMDAVDTTNIEPMAHPIAANQRLRKDETTEANQRELFQNIAPGAENNKPCVEAGLYLVPQVIE